MPPIFCAPPLVAAAGALRFLSFALLAPLHRFGCLLAGSPAPPGCRFCAAGAFFATTFFAAPHPAMIELVLRVFIQCCT